MPKQSDTETKELSPAEIEAKRQALIAELDALPAPKVDGLRPGTKVGDGYAADYVPFTTEWFLDIEARRKDKNPDGSLTFAGGYDLHEFIPNETLDVSVNGIAFRLYAGRRCKLPTPHYLVYMDRIKQLQDLEAKYTPPEGGPKPMQVYRIDGPWKKQDLTQE